MYRFVNILALQKQFYRQYSGKCKLFSQSQFFIELLYNIVNPLNSRCHAVGDNTNLL